MMTSASVEVSTPPLCQDITFPSKGRRSPRLGAAWAPMPRASNNVKNGPQWPSQLPVLPQLQGRRLKQCDAQKRAVALGLRQPRLRQGRATAPGALEVRADVLQHPVALPRRPDASCTGVRRSALGASSAHGGRRGWRWRWQWRWRWRRRWRRRGHRRRRGGRRRRRGGRLRAARRRRRRARRRRRQSRRLRAAGRRGSD
mmetsp:Transcript_28341/g.75684  ORF Transcript_28341/g.75684 Transcript_28341/m.75684 type:complete len:200 (-) Transcript_28341:1146-1745(-)